VRAKRLVRILRYLAIQVLDLFRSILESLKILQNVESLKMILVNLVASTTGLPMETPVVASTRVFHSLHDTPHPIKSRKFLEAPAAMMERLRR
jgi:hypothetical protein